MRSHPELNVPTLATVNGIAVNGFVHIVAFAIMVAVIVQETVDKLLSLDLC
jgi:hypothetical protein